MSLDCAGVTKVVFSIFSFHPSSSPLKNHVTFTLYQIKEVVLIAISIHPRPGQILLCDFSHGFKEPEMVKSARPVLVLAGAIKGRANLITVVPLSTVEPDPVQLYHYRIPRQSMPMLGKFQANDSWLKGDMIYTVGFHRLNLISLGKRGGWWKKAIFY